MFASNTAEVLNFEKKEASSDALKSILLIYKKLKDIARIESNIKPKYKIAYLTNEQLQRVKHLEDNIQHCLVAYDVESKTSLKKHNILNQIQQLLNEYINLLKASKQNIVDNSFSELFES